MCSLSGINTSGKMNNHLWPFFAKQHARACLSTSTDTMDNAYKSCLSSDFGHWIKQTMSSSNICEKKFVCRWQHLYSILACMLGGWQTDFYMFFCRYDPSNIDFVVDTKQPRSNFLASNVGFALEVMSWMIFLNCVTYTYQDDLAVWSVGTSAGADADVCDVDVQAYRINHGIWKSRRSLM